MDWSTAQVEHVLVALGFELARQEAHDSYTRQGHPRVVSVPRNRKSIPVGTCASIWRQAGITAAEAKAIREGQG